MALLRNLDNRTQQKEIYKTLELKLWLEDKMYSDLMSLFKRMSTAFAEHYSHHGNELDLNSFDIDMTATLRKWYRKTADIFSKNIRDDLKANSDMLEFKADNLTNTPKDKQKINAEIAAALMVFIEKQSKEQSSMIIDTSKKIINETVDRIKKELESTGKPYGDREIAEAVRKDFNQRSIARSDLISKQEIGTMASESKQTEARVLDKSDAEVGIGAVVISLKNTMYKNWNAELDMHTRASHAAADFRYKFNPIPIEDYFEVGGEKLKYPRDPMGSPGNIIHCRCEELYVTKPL